MWYDKGIGSGGAKVKKYQDDMCGTIEGDIIEYYVKLSRLLAYCI